MSCKNPYACCPCLLVCFRVDLTAHRSPMRQRTACGLRPATKRAKWRRVATCCSYPRSATLVGREMGAPKAVIMMAPELWNRLEYGLPPTQGREVLDRVRLGSMALLGLDGLAACDSI